MISPTVKYRPPISDPAGPMRATKAAVEAVTASEIRARPQKSVKWSAWSPTPNNAIASRATAEEPSA